MKIETQITFTPWTIDTYNVFTCEHEEEAILDDLGGNYDDYDWEYDFEGYIKALALNWLKIVNEYILDDVIKGVELVDEPYSPREYNFTTDNCQVSFNVDIKKLNEYIENNREAYNNEHIRSCDGFMWFGDDNDTKLHWYLHTVSEAKLPREVYIQTQYEEVPATEYITYINREA